MAMQSYRSGPVVSSLLLFSGLILLAILLMQPLELFEFRQYISVLFPNGMIAYEQRNLLLLIQGLMLLVIVPVYFLTFFFSWRYRANNPNSKYDPDLVDNKLAEVVWWGLPFVLTLIVSVITWIKTAELDPYKPIASDRKALKVQVVALQWKWLFIYPEEKIAALNVLHFPAKTPIEFEITADAPMNSFWIPSLGGQIYAMPNMKTKLHLIADETGEFRGASANISGRGFSSMHFVAKATSDDEYREWVLEAQRAPTLDDEVYRELALPSEKAPPQLFKLADTELFNAIVMKYMHPSESDNEMSEKK